MIRHSSILVFLACAFIATSVPAAPQPTAFIFNGHLVGVTDDVDARFTLWDSASGGTQVGSALRFDGTASNSPPVTVFASSYGVSLDFGAAAFSSGAARWLQAEYRVPHDPSNTGAYAVVTPRQPIGQTGLATMSTNTRGLTVDSSNRVNIGSAAPSELLQLDSGNLWLNGENAGFIVGAGNKSSGMMKYAGHESGFWRGSGTAFSIGRVSTSDVTTGTPSATPDLFISGTGNVGIGTASPGNLLTVAGSIGTTSGLVFPDGTTQTVAVQPSAIVNPSGGTFRWDQFVDTPASDGSTVQMNNVWQSFQCGLSGKLTKINVQPSGTIPADIAVTLNIYDGPTPGSPLLGSYAGTIKAGAKTGGRQLSIPIESAPSVVLGNRYTFQLISGTSWTGDASSRNPYPGGQCSFNGFYDLIFGTGVTTGYTKGLVTMAGDLKFSSFKGANAISTCQLQASHNSTLQIFPYTDPNLGLPILADSYATYTLPRGLAVFTWSTSCWSQITTGLKVRAAPYIAGTNGSQTGPSVAFYFNTTNKHMVMSGSAVFDLQTAGSYQLGLKLGSDNNYVMADGNDFISWTVTVYRY